MVGSFFVIPTKIILVSYPDYFRLKESKSLVDAAFVGSSYKIVKLITNKYLGNSKFGLSSGKSMEIKEYAKEYYADQIIIDERLNSKQIYNLEKLTGIQIKDRERLILDIFYSRASTVEAKLQIQLAEIQYELPRTRENAKITSLSERPGKGGQGEYIVDVKFRDLKRRIGFIKTKLEYAKQQRELYQHQRLKNDIPVISLIGYTSSGKTTLFNRLTNDNKKTSPTLFTTLSTTTRSFQINYKKILITDTIGFISRLPTYMIDAFKSTLEESLAADMILLMLDSSENMEDIKIKYYSCRDILNELKVEKSKVFIIFSKFDKFNFLRSEQILHDLGIPYALSISSKSGYGLHKLKTLIADYLKI
ncbi:MAG: GTPase HflX [Nitrososphaeraceae archaeon]